MEAGRTQRLLTPRTCAAALCYWPAQVAQVSFTEWTHYGLLRHATYEGLVDDKEPNEVIKERPAGGERH